MKILLAAIAMTIAVPAAAQTAQPAADPHAGHTMPATQGQAVDPAAHKEHMNCCEKMKAEGKAMDCCAEKTDAAGAADAHAGHDMGG